MPARTQISVRDADGKVVHTANSAESRPALSLSKLFLGYWVLENGAPGDKVLVEDMIRVSNDATASQLERAYPQAIPEIIEDFDLDHTFHNGYWGLTSTSTDDVTLFLSEIYGDPTAAPLFLGMKNAAPVASDGYPQNFGTANIDDVRGTKFGWSDDRGVHASVSYGSGSFVAAITYGSAQTHTADVLAAVDSIESAPEPAPTSESAPTRALPTQSAKGTESDEDGGFFLDNLIFGGADSIEKAQEALLARGLSVGSVNSIYSC